MTTDLANLATAISKLDPSSREEVETAFQKVVNTNKRRKRIAEVMREAMAQLLLDTKYLMFDLEATRRERDSYRDQCGIILEDAPRPLDDRLGEGQ